MKYILICLFKKFGSKNPTKKTKDQKRQTILEFGIKIEIKTKTKFK